jgi:uridine kinase
VSPAGLDGNPDPLRTPARAAVLATVAEAVESVPRHPGLIAIDGIDGAGKSTFADELAAELSARGTEPVLRSTVDLFHRPRQDRHRRGRLSPEGFYLDSHDLNTLQTALLEPFHVGGPVRLAAFDEPSDTPVEAPLVSVPASAVLLFDGIFLQRPELDRFWDLTIYVDGRRRVEHERTQLALDGRPAAPAEGFLHDLGWWSRFRRYVDGQRLYHELCQPDRRADLVFENNDRAHPSIAARRALSGE